MSMELGLLSQVTMTGLNFFSTLFVFTIGLVALGLVVLFAIDISQTHDAVRRNYPVIGRFRYLFSTLGEFFRQYFFAMDREEMPFNRAEREWVYKSASGKDNMIAFGSTRNLTPVGTPIFVNCPFPTLDIDATETEPVTIGPYTPNPYTATSIINISGMSYGALSKPAVRALSRGAKLADCWMNTGEGGLSPYHLEGDCDIVFQIGTAKPGKGGILPAAKVNEEIARIRGIPAHQDSIFPNRHPEIDSVPDLLDLIQRIRTATGKPTGFKSVIGAYGWLEEMCREIHERGKESAPDFITVDSGEGGTGAAPMPLMDNVGLPIRESLSWWSIFSIATTCEIGSR